MLPFSTAHADRRCSLCPVMLEKTDTMQYLFGWLRVHTEASRAGAKSALDWMEAIILPSRKDLRLFNRRPLDPRWGNSEMQKVALTGIEPVFRP